VVGVLAGLVPVGDGGVVVAWSLAWPCSIDTFSDVVKRTGSSMWNRYMLHSPECSWTLLPRVMPWYGPAYSPLGKPRHS
jgi:hypothetical protein